MGYKFNIASAMQDIAKDPSSLFIGYGLYPNGANGTLRNIPKDKFIEMPVAENLMTGIAIGQSLMGRKPIVYFERFDFILNALDQIVNHLDKTELISNGEFKPAVLMRAFIGGTTKPLFTGPTHTQDFTESLKSMIDIPVIRLSEESDPYSL